ncbi:sigma-70 family RNA polymerase sigma factor [Pradoshia sp.]
MEEFENIAEQYTPLIHHMIKRLNIYKDKEEFIQIGLIALWEASRAFDPAKGQFMSYAFLTIKGRMLSHIQKTNKIHHRETSKEIEMERANQDDELILTLEWLIPKAFLDTLTSNQSCWLTHHIQYGKTTAEIAADLHITVASVKSWKRTTIKKLQAYYRLHPESF